MPDWMSPEEEKDWERAKGIISKEYPEKAKEKGDAFYALVMTVYKNIRKGHEDKAEDVTSEIQPNMDAPVGGVIRKRMSVQEWVSLVREGHESLRSSLRGATPVQRNEGASVDGHGGTGNKARLQGIAEGVVETWLPVGTEPEVGDRVRVLSLRGRPLGDGTVKAVGVQHVTLEGVRLAVIGESNGDLFSDGGGTTDAVGLVRPLGTDEVFPKDMVRWVVLTEKPYARMADIQEAFSLRRDTFGKLSIDRGSSVEEIPLQPANEEPHPALVVIQRTLPRISQDEAVTLWADTMQFGLRRALELHLIGVRDGYALRTALQRANLLMRFQETREGETAEGMKAWLRQAIQNPVVQPPLDGLGEGVPVSST